ncbi:MAG: hypothetical protein KKD86_17555 [Bacteroidetes bacterium]|nr:hypothetical protein [Bacteroidota bacterium]
MGFLSQMVRSADVVALTDSKLIVLTQSSVQKAIKEIQQIINKVLFNLSLILCERLRLTNASLVEKFVVN